MQSFSNLLPLFSGLVTAGSSSIQSYPKTSYLSVPVNLHVFNGYYSTHNSYRYLDNYSFQDQVLVFDRRANTRQNLSQYLFSDLKHEDSRQWTGEESYSNDHLIHSFINWNQERSGERLKDILRIDLSKSESIFEPIKKDIYLRYDHPHTSTISLYAFNFYENTNSNLYDVDSFSKLKTNPKKLSEIYTSGASFDTCDDARKHYLPHQISPVLDQNGFDGVCGYIPISNVNRNFMGDRAKSTLWSTPYAAYKSADIESWWYPGRKEQYYYTLGDMVDRPDRSHNLLPTSEDIWFVDYNHVFALVSDGSNLKVTLNDKSEFLQGLNLFSSDSTPSKQLLDFLKISSDLKFEISFDYFGKNTKQAFSMQDILEDKVTINEATSDKAFITNVFLSVSSANPEKIKVIGGNNLFTESSLRYSINVDSLIKDNIMFDDVVFVVPDPQNILPSEFRDYERLSEYFYLVSSDRNRKSKASKSFLANLNISGSVNDVDGTSTINYQIQNKRHQINLSGMATLPYITSAKIFAKSIDDIPAQLRGKFPELSKTLWNSFDFTEKDNKASFRHKASVVVTEKDQGLNERITRDKSWDLSKWNIEIVNPRDISLIARLDVDKYDHISDLFNLSDYASQLLLTKDDYVYDYSMGKDNTIEVTVSLNKSSDTVSGLINKGQIDVSDITKKYVFDSRRLKKTSSEPEKEEKKQEGTLSWLFGDNAVLLGSGTIFSGAIAASIFKKLGFLKSKII